MNLPKVLMVMLFALSSAGVVFGQGSLKVEPAGVMVVGKQEKEGFDGLRPFHSEVGTRMAFMVEGTGLIDIDTKGSKILSFTDDKGRSLLKKKGFGGDGFDAFPKVNDERTVGIVEIKAVGVPGKGSKLIKAKGILKVARATKSKVSKSKKVPFKEGAKITAGAYTFEVKKMGKPSFGDDPQEITLKISKELTAIRAFRFLDANGKEVESRGTGKSSLGFNKNVTIERSFGLKKALTSGILELDIWQDKKDVTVPFDVSVGVGLGQ